MNHIVKKAKRIGLHYFSIRYSTNELTIYLHFMKGGVQNMNAKPNVFCVELTVQDLNLWPSLAIDVLPTELTAKPFFVKCKYPMFGVMPYVIRAARITHECKIQNWAFLYRLHHSCSRNGMSHMANTGNETWTRIVFPPMDFKSIASTNSAMPVRCAFLHTFISRHEFEDSAFISPF